MENNESNVTKGGMIGAYALAGLAGIGLYSVCKSVADNVTRLIEVHRIKKCTKILSDCTGIIANVEKRKEESN